MKLGMKAWLVREKDEFCATVVFAETRGKAKALAMYTEACEDADFLDIEIRRVPQMDKYYSDGKTEMSWFEKADRIALVQECDFTCDTEAYDITECPSCPAAPWCDRYQDNQQEGEVNKNG